MLFCIVLFMFLLVATDNKIYKHNIQLVIIPVAKPKAV